MQFDAIYERWNATPMAAALRRLASRHVYTKDEVGRLANEWHQAPGAELIAAIKLKSMLHEKTLSLLHHFAGKVRGAILAIGPYTGGSTVAMAMALRDDVPPITIEVGGSHEQHPHLPSFHILADLEANPREIGGREPVTIITGVSSAPAAVCEVENRLAGRRMDLFLSMPMAKWDAISRFIGPSWRSEPLSRSMISRLRTLTRVSSTTLYARAFPRLSAPGWSPSWVSSCLPLGNAVWPIFAPIRPGARHD